MNNKTEYQHEIDCLRGLACLVVLMRHMRVFWYADCGVFPEGWFHGLSFFAVPAFFFISGYALTLNYKDNLEIKSFYKKRFITLLPIYFTWPFFTILFQDLTRSKFMKFY